MALFFIILAFIVLSARAQDCGQLDFIGPTGFISSPNYPADYDDNLDCSYSILSEAGSSHTLTFLDFALENGYDYIVLNCGTNSSFSGVLYTGYEIPPPVSIPWCGTGMVHLWTDEDTTDRGFNIQFQVSTGGCGNTVFNDPFGAITSPGYPSPYGPNQNCSYIMWATAATDMTLSFQEFSLQESANCANDFVQVTCLDDNTVLGRFCGADLPDDIEVASCQTIVVWFNSDNADVEAGFNLFYTINLPSTGPCGQTAYTDPTGTITSPNYPGNYVNNLSCYYTIFTTPGTTSTHTLTFTAFEVEAGWDYLDVYCSTDPSIPRVRYSGFTLPPVTVLPGCQNTQLYFFTDETVVFTGFSVDYVVTDNADGSIKEGTIIGSSNYQPPDDSIIVKKDKNPLRSEKKWQKITP